MEAIRKYMAIFVLCTASHAWSATASHRSSVTNTQSSMQRLHNLSERVVQYETFRALFGASAEEQQRTLRQLCGAGRQVRYAVGERAVPSACALHPRRSLIAKAWGEQLIIESFGGKQITPVKELRSTVDANKRTIHSMAWHPTEPILSVSYKNGEILSYYFDDSQGLITKSCGSNWDERTAPVQVKWVVKENLPLRVAIEKNFHAIDVCTVKSEEPRWPTLWYTSASQPEYGAVSKDAVTIEYFDRIEEKMVNTVIDWGHLQDMGWSADRNYVAAIKADEVVIVKKEVINGVPIFHTEIFSFKTGQKSHFAWSSTGASFAHVSATGEFKIYDLSETKAFGDTRTLLRGRQDQWCVAAGTLPLHKVHAIDWTGSNLLVVGEDAAGNISTQIFNFCTNSWNSLNTAQQAFAYELLMGNDANVTKKDIVMMEQTINLQRQSTAGMTYEYPIACKEMLNKKVDVYKKIVRKKNILLYTLLTSAVAAVSIFGYVWYMRSHQRRVV